MICVDSHTLADGTVVLVPAAVAPVDPSGCAAVVLQGADVLGYSLLTTLPTADDGGELYVFGLALVVVPYIVARAAGSVLSMIR